MARKTVLVCDNCGAEVGEGKGATLRLNYTDARRGSSRPICVTTAPARCQGAPLRDEGAGRRPPRHNSLFALLPDDPL